MEIRRAEDVDCDSIVAIGRCVWIDTYATEGVRKEIAGYVQSTFTAKNVLRDIDSKQVSVFELESHIVGYAVLSESSEATEIENLYILPRYQRKGLGKLFIHHVIKNHARIWLTCWERNTKAIAFYKSLGFEEVGETYFQMKTEKHRNVLLNLSI